MQRALWSAAERFRSTFPAVDFDSSKFARVVGRTKRASGGAPGQVSSLVLGLLGTPPVRDLLVPFIHDQVAAAWTSVGAEDPEAGATRFLEGLLADTPALGLKVVIAAARGSASIVELRRLDAIIADLHPVLQAADLLPLGPLEHPAGDEDQTPSSQWKGHLSAHCGPDVEHDVLVVLAGRSVGVGEAVSIARQMRIPVIVAAPTDTGPPSCRLQPDGDLIQSTITGVRDELLPAAIVDRVVSVAVMARREQRNRMLRMMDSNGYRSYLADQPRSAGLGPAFASQITDPFQFLNSSDHAIAHLASELDAFEEGDLRLHSVLDDITRAAYDSVARPLPRAQRVVLLRRGSESILAQASDPRDHRWLDWSIPATWSRMLQKIQSAS